MRGERDGRAKRPGAGAGGAALGAAKLVFLAAAYVTSTGLAWIWKDDPATFGRYALVGVLIAVPNMVLIQTMLYAVSRPLANQYDEGLPAYSALRRRGFAIAAGLGGLVSLAFFLGAGPLAALVSDPLLAWPLRVVSPIALVYALYAVNVGTINATRRFYHQAALDAFMAVTKSALILGTAWAGYGLAHTLGGFTAASLAVLALSTGFVLWTRPAGLPGAPPGPAPPMVQFAGLLVAFTLSVNLLQGADLFILKLLTPAGREDVVGTYSGALLVARVPFSVMNAAALVLFPLVASLDATGDAETTRAYLEKAARLCLGLLVFMSAVGCAAAPEILALVFPEEYGEAAGQLRLLVWGYSGYSLMVTVAWVLNSSRRTAWALVLGGATVALATGLCVVGGRGWGPGGVAAGVAAAGGLSGCGALALLWRCHGARVPWPFLLKLAVGVALVTLAGQAWAASGAVGILAKLTGLSLVFLAWAALSRMTTLAEVRELRRAT